MRAVAVSGCRLRAVSACGLWLRTTSSKRWCVRVRNVKGC